MIVVVVLFILSGGGFVRMLNNIDRGQTLCEVRSRLLRGLRLSLLANGFGNNMDVIEVERMRATLPNYHR
jgi:hypothetical protein